MLHGTKQFQENGIWLCSVIIGKNQIIIVGKMFTNNSCPKLSWNKDCHRLEKNILTAPVHVDSNDCKPVYECYYLHSSIF